MAKAHIGIGIGLGWIAGVSASVFGVPTPLSMAGLVLATCAVFLKKPWRHLMFALGICFAVAFLHAQFQLAWVESGRMLVYDEPVAIRGYVSSEPTRSGEFERFRFRPDKPHTGDILVFGRVAMPLDYGQNVAVSGIVRPPEERGGEPVIFSAEITRREGARGSPLLRFLYAVRRSNAAALHRLFPGDAGALMSGLLLGTIEGMSKETVEAMRRSGATHLVALSGYNVAILVLALSATLRNFLSRRAVWLTVSVVVFLFMLMSGSEPSIVRASLMGFVLLWAKELGRTYSLPHATLFAGVIMLLGDPLLIRSPGFQLSFASLLGISYGADGVLAALLRVRLPRWIAEPAALTFAAQIAVAPLLLVHFGEISAWALPTNILILPLVPTAMGLGFLTLILQWVFVPLAQTMALLIRLLLEYDLGIIRWFGGTEAGIRFSVTPLIFSSYYLLLAGWWWKTINSRSTT